MCVCVCVRVRVCVCVLARACVLQENMQWVSGWRVRVRHAIAAVCRTSQHCALPVCSEPHPGAAREGRQEVMRKACGLMLKACVLGAQSAAAVSATQVAGRHSNARLRLSRPGPRR